MTSSVLLTQALPVLAVLLAGLVVAASLRKALRETGDRRRAALQAAARPRLLALLSEDEPDLVALDDLGRAAGRTLEELAQGLLPKLRGEDRDALVALLERRGALAAARRRTRRPGPVGRARAAHLLGVAGDRRAADDLVRLLGDRDAGVRIVAARAIGKLGDPGTVPALLAAVESRRSIPATVVTMALIHIGPAAVEPLRPALRSPAPVVRRLAAELLGVHGDHGSTDALIAALGDADAEVRLAAARALGRLASPQAVRALADGLRSGDERLAVACATALGQIGGTAAVLVLRAALLAQREAVAIAAASGLASCGRLGRDVLRGAAASDEHPTGFAAREALASLALTRGTTREAVAA